VADPVIVSGAPPALPLSNSLAEVPQLMSNSSPMRTRLINALAGAGLLLLGGLATAAEPLPLDIDSLKPTREHTIASLNTVELLRRHHYNRIRLDDALSSEIFDTYLQLLDPQRSLFSAWDIREFEVNRYHMDDHLLAGNLEPGFSIHRRQLARAIQRSNFMLAQLDKGLQKINLDSDQNIETNREKSAWAEDDDALQLLWRLQLKDEILRLKLAGRDSDAIIDTLGKRYRNQQLRLNQTRSEDMFQNYINALAQVYDPHTQYMSPELAENFDINMSLSLEGIGAVLQSDNEFTRIVRLVPAGPAERSQQLSPADRIAGVAQGNEEMVDVVGWRLDEVVKMIRGPKGSRVRLEVIPASNPPSDMSTREVVLTREAVKLEDQAARSHILELEHEGQSNRVGVIEVPGFYMDFKAYRRGDPDYRSTTRDVRRLLGELRDDGVTAVVLDLRNNGGGSLQEATELTGLFIDRGPTVLVRDSQGQIQIMDDTRSGIAWEGPMTVLVNRLSASASEIFAGAMQDYGRALIIGEPTFGKGTVQSVQPLNHGELKLTLAKFYRISGQSTQNRGVLPDIQFPSRLDTAEIGESSLPRALPWDSIAPVSYRHDRQLRSLLGALQERHEHRTASHPDFVYTRARNDLEREMRDMTLLPLNEARRRTQQQDYESRLLVLENQRRQALGETPLSKLERNEQPLSHGGSRTAEEIAKDPFLAETGKILLDVLRLNLDEQLAKAS